MQAGQVGWQQHKMSVIRLGSGPGSNMHIIAMHFGLQSSGKWDGHPLSGILCAEPDAAGSLYPRLDRQRQCALEPSV